eukprot:6853245-Pyramimonas_sp.AAC.1
MHLGRSRCGTRGASLSREAPARRCAHHACDARPTQGNAGPTPSRGQGGLQRRANGHRQEREIH